LLKLFLHIDWEQVGFGPENARLRAPGIDKFQEAMEAGVHAFK